MCNYIFVDGTICKSERILCSKPVFTGCILRYWDMRNLVHVRGGESVREKGMRIRVRAIQRCGEKEKRIRGKGLVTFALPHAKLKK